MKIHYFKSKQKKVFDENWSVTKNVPDFVLLSYKPTYAWTIYLKDNFLEKALIGQKKISKKAFINELYNYVHTPFEEVYEEVYDLESRIFVTKIFLINAGR